MFQLVVVVGASILYGFSVLAITTLRQRKTGPLSNEENGDQTSEQQPLSKDIEKSKEKKSNLKNILFIIAIALIILIVILLIVYWYIIKNQSSTSPYPPYKCEPLTKEERMQYMKEFEPIIPKFDFSSNEVKLLFLQGFGLITDFNRHEAKNAFKMAVDVDQKCAICYWGLGLAQGPFPNYVGGEPSPHFPVFDDQTRIEALKSAQKAEEFMDQNNEKLKSYIHALVQRYNGDSNWVIAEQQFALDMQKIYEKYPDDLAALTIACDANMTSSAWDYYDENGNLKSQFQATYNHLKFINEKQQNSYALHLLVHLTEEFLPFEGEKFADELASIQNLPHAHLVHMPSHTYLRVGRYHDVYVQNVQSYGIELQHGKRCFATTVPEHNVLVGIVGASMAGEYGKAEELAVNVKRLPYEMPAVYQAPGAEWTTYPLLMIRFAKWSKLAEFLDTDIPDAKSRGPSHLNGKEYSDIVQSYGFIMYLTAISEAWSRYGTQIPDTDIENFEIVADHAKSSREMAIGYLDKLRDQAHKLPYDVQVRPGKGVGIYSMAYKNLSAIYLEIAEARVSVLDQDFKTAEFHLQNAVKIEDNTGYIEPPRLYQPVRQCLGWVREMLGDFVGAKNVYEEDLKEFPKNGWSLFGLISVQRQREQSTEDLEKQFQEAWKYADYRLDSGCPAFSRITDN